MKEGENSLEGEKHQQGETNHDTEVGDNGLHPEQEQVVSQGDAEQELGVTGETEYHEQESEEASPVQHNSSGYASDGSGAGGNGDNGQCPDTGVMTHGGSIQSDPHQSAFRPAGVPGPSIQAQPGYPNPGMEAGHLTHPGQEFQFRQNGGHGGPGPGHNWTGPDDMTAGYGPPIGMMTQAAPHPMTGHPQMHTPIARRPITGNMSGCGYPPNPGYRPQPGHFPTSPGGGPHNNQYRQAQAYNGSQCGGWGSPSWSGNGPPSGPPPMSMTPPPLSWNQAQNRRPPNLPQQNKPFGNVQYGGMMQNQMRSKNYPFPSKALQQDCMEDVYGGGRGPLDTMRSLEHYLPEQGHGGQRNPGIKKKDLLAFIYNDNFVSTMIENQYQQSIIYPVFGPLRA